MHAQSVVAPITSRLPGWAIDVLLGAALALTMAAVITVNHGGQNDPDALAYLWAIGLGALMLARRRYPVIVLAVTVLGLFAYYAADYPAVGVAVPIAAALYSAAEFGRMAYAIGAGIIALVASMFFRLVEGQEISLVAGYELAGHTFLIAGAIALGDSVRSRRALAENARQMVALTSQRARRESEAQAQAQRIAVARDLHDSIGHSTTVISLHADVAREAVERGDDGAATGALAVIKDATGSTMSDLRRTVTLLRTSEQSGLTAKGLADIYDLGAGTCDVHISTDIAVSQKIPAAVEDAAYRIIQEAITNTTRHSRASRAHIEVRCPGTELTITVSDDGGPPEPEGSGMTAFEQAASGQVSSAHPGSARSAHPGSARSAHPGSAQPGSANSAPPNSGHPQRARAVPSRTPVGSGYGIAGMRERAEALGGTVQAGPGRDGFIVHARIPVGRHR